jgi:hypothetical protein
VQRAYSGQLKVWIDVTMQAGAETDEERKAEVEREFRAIPKDYTGVSGASEREVASPCPTPPRCLRQLEHH